MSYYLTLIGTRDNPLYETEIVSKTASSSSNTGETAVTSPLSGSFFGAGGGGASSLTGAMNSSSGGGSGGSSSVESAGGSGMFGSLLSRLPTAATTTSSSSSSSTAASIASTRTPTAMSNGARRKQRYELQMIAHSSLDTIEDALTTSGYLYLKSIDRIQEYTTSCFVVPGNIKFVLLHEHRLEDGIKNFFLEIWEAYLKVALNPFQDPNAPISNPTFEARVKTAARKHL